MCTEMCMEMCVQMCTNMCVQMCMEMCVQMCMEMCVQMNMDTCEWKCVICIEMLFFACYVYEHECRFSVTFLLVAMVLLTNKYHHIRLQTVFVLNDVCFINKNETACKCSHTIKPYPSFCGKTHAVGRTNTSLYIYLFFYYFIIVLSFFSSFLTITSFYV